MDALTAAGQSPAYTPVQMAWAARDKKKASGGQPGAPVVSGAAGAAAQTEGAALQRPANATGQVSSALASDTLVISAAALRASVEKAWEALHESSDTLEIPGVEKVVANGGVVDMQVRTQAVGQPETPQEYTGIPFIVSHLDSYTGGQSDVATGNVDTRSERLKAIMDGKEARQGLELDKNLALSATRTVSLLVQRLVPPHKKTTALALAARRGHAWANGCALARQRRHYVRGNKTRGNIRGKLCPAGHSRRAGAGGGTGTPHPQAHL